MNHHSFKTVTGLFVSGVFLAGFIIACSPKTPPTNNTLTAKEKAAGWILLFDGKSFTGWHGLGQEEFPAKLWTIEGDAIKKLSRAEGPKMPDGQPKHGCDLITDASFENYEFAFDWKISPGGNSGVKYNVSEELSTSRKPDYAALGWEYQVLDDEKHADNTNPTHRAAALYDILPAVNKTLKPVGEFNHAKIRIEGKRSEHWLNGIKVLEYDFDSPEFETLFQKSKYHDIVGFKEKKKGHIVLQDHSDAVWYRNLKIRILQ